MSRLLKFMVPPESFQWQVLAYLFGASLYD